MTQAIFIQPLSDHRPALYVFGAGHVGQAIAVTASALPIRLNLVDSRSDIMTHFAAPDNCILLCEDPLSRVPSNRRQGRGRHYDS